MTLLERFCYTYQDGYNRLATPVGLPDFVEIARRFIAVPLGQPLSHARRFIAVRVIFLDNTDIYIPAGRFYLLAPLPPAYHLPPTTPHLKLAS